MELLMSTIRFAVFSGVSALSTGLCIVNLVDAVAVVPAQHVMTIGELSGTSGAAAMATALCAFRELALELVQRLQGSARSPMSNSPAAQHAPRI